MKLPTFRHILGSFRLLRRRAVEVERPGLAVWAEAGEQAAVGVAAVVRDQAHRAECRDLEAVELLRSAASHGFTKADLPSVALAIRKIRGAAEDCHNVTEAAQL